MEQVLTLLEGMASKLGVAVEHLWEVLVRQQQTQGITDLIWAGIDIVIIICLAIFGTKLIKYVREQYAAEKEARLSGGYTDYCNRNISSDKEDWLKIFMWLIPIFGGLFVIIAACSFALNLELGIQKLLNPEYFALKELLDTIKGG